MEIASLTNVSHFEFSCFTAISRRHTSATVPMGKSNNSDDCHSELRVNTTRDADVLLLLWDGIKARENEVDHLLDLSLCVLSSAPEFPERIDIERMLRKALSLIRDWA